MLIRPHLCFSICRHGGTLVFEDWCRVDVEISLGNCDFHLRFRKSGPPSFARGGETPSYGTVMDSSNKLVSRMTAM